MSDTLVTPLPTAPMRLEAEWQTAKIRTLTRAASRGAFWSGLTVVIKGSVRFLTTALLARQLGPADFGVVGMALVVNELFTLFGQLSLSEALVQRKDADEAYYDTVFWINLLVGGLISLVIVLSAPAAARFFQAASVAPVLCALSLHFFLGLLPAVHRTILARRLRFDLFALVNISAALAGSALALTGVFLGWGVWSIVVGLLMERAVMLLLYAVLVPWRPRLRCELWRFRELFRFSRNLYGQQMLSFVNARSDRLVTGRLLGPVAMGFYQFASGIPQLALSHIAETMTDVLFPVYAKVQTDLARFRRGYARTCTLVSLLTFPLMAGLVVMAPEFLLVAYGAKWLPVLTPLRILCLVAMWGSVYHTISMVLKAVGRPDVGLKWNLVMAPVTVGVVLVGARWGVLGVAIASAVLAPLSLLPTWLALRLIGMRMQDFFRALLPASAGSLAMLGIVWLAETGLKAARPALPPLAMLAIMALVGAAAYAAIMRRWWPEAFKEFWGVVRHMIT